MGGTLCFYKEAKPWEDRIKKIEVVNPDSAA
jgi:hypothetical protein